MKFSKIIKLKWKITLHTNMEYFLFLTAIHGLGILLVFKLGGLSSVIGYLLGCLVFYTLKFMGS